MAVVVSSRALAREHAFVECPTCQTALPREYFNAPAPLPCPKCGMDVTVEAYPAFDRPYDPVNIGEKILVDGEASCFYHPQKRAATHCEECGRFLCALCDVDFGGRHLCPNCIQSGKKKKKIVQLDNKRILYDSLAMSLSILPFFLVYTTIFTIFTAPAALYLSLRHWNSPSSVLPRTKIRFIIAIAFALMQIAAWILIVVLLIMKFQE